MAQSYVLQERTTSYLGSIVQTSILALNFLSVPSVLSLCTTVLLLEGGGMAPGSAAEGGSALWLWCRT